MAYLDLLKAVAQVVGGTQPNSAQASSWLTSAQQQYWYSGIDSGDNSGVAGLQGCFAIPTEVIPVTPIGMVLPDGWDPLEPFPVQGQKFRDDLVHIRIFVGDNDMQSLMAQLVNFADSVPTQFDTHMKLFQSTNVLTADCSQGRFLEVNWGGAAYFAVEFRLHVQRGIPVVRVG